jgi:zinc protease
MRKSLSSPAAVAALVIGLVVLAAPFLAAQTAKIDIPYQKFTLDNGLTLIVHEDHKAPIVAFNVWYHVGSKNEVAGKTGFAHLFEHLMFNGSENYDDDYFKPMQKIGATDLNGTTNEDRTNYFETVPVSALDVVLWMESERMGHLKGAISQAKLDEQRGVVQNELRQYQNEPYSVTEDLIIKGTYPPNHPYSWSVGGSIEDVGNATLEDVRKWFSTYYGPNNAVVVIAGDVDTKTVVEKVKTYFGDIPPSPPVARHSGWVAKRTGSHRQSVQDRVAQARIYKVWNIPGWGTECADKLDLVSSILADGKTSRLYKRLVYDDQLATSVSAYINTREIAGIFQIQADARPGVALAQVEKAIDEELARFLKEGPTAAEVERVKAQYAARFVRGVERIGGFSGKTDILASSMIYGGSPDAYKKTLGHIDTATPEGLKESANHWLSDGVYVLEVTPYPAFVAAKTGADRKTIPAAGAAPEAKFPAVERATLANGMKVVLAERHAVPVVNLALIFDAGYAADKGGLPGTASLAMTMLDEGTEKRTSLEISEELARLGAELGTGAGLDTCQVALSALKDKLDPALDVFADVVLDPAFPQADFDRLQKIQIAQIGQEKDTPIYMALRILPRLVYGEGHAYAAPFTGSGTEASVARLKREDLVRFHKAWFKPGNATLVVVGDTTLAEIKPRIEKLFRGWQAGAVPAKDVKPVALRAKPAVYIIDKPGAPQSVVICGHPATPSADPDAIAIETMNDILGGDFISRINLNIREDKHWSYGAMSLLFPARGQRMFLAYAPVQADKTKETMIEIRGEMEGVLGKKPITADEFRNMKASKVLGLPGRWETASAVQSSLAEIVSFGLPADFYQKYSAQVQKLALEDLAKAAKKILRPDALTWVVVGDRAQIEPRIRELGIADVFVIDADGNIVK